MEMAKYKKPIPVAENGKKTLTTAATAINSAVLKAPSATR